MRETTLRRRPLRRLRELVCFGTALGLWLLAWAFDRGGFTGTRGHRIVVALGVVEACTLALLFVLEARRPRRRPELPWITMAWLTLPIWVVAEVVAASVLRATS